MKLALASLFVSFPMRPANSFRISPMVIPSVGIEAAISEPVIGPVPMVFWGDGLDTTVFRAPDCASGPKSFG